MKFQEYDLTTISTVINNYLNLNWITEIEDMHIGGLDTNYAWIPIEGKSTVHIVKDIDEIAMKEDFYNTLNGNPTKLIE